eukprot:UN2844
MQITPAVRWRLQSLRQAPRYLCSFIRADRSSCQDCSLRKACGAALAVPLQTSSSTLSLSFLQASCTTHMIFRRVSTFCPCSLMMWVAPSVLSVMKPRPLKTSSASV